MKNSNDQSSKPHHRRTRHGQVSPVKIGIDMPTCFKISMALDWTLPKIPKGTPGVDALGQINRYLKEKILLALNCSAVTQFQSITISEPDEDLELPF